MHLSITNNVTPAEKEELFVGLRAYNGQFLDMATFSGDIGVTYETIKASCSAG